MGLGLALHRDRAGWRVEITPELLNQRLAGLGVLNDQLPVGNGIGEFGQSVAARQQQHDQFVIDLDLVGPHAIQHALDHMSERHHMVQTEEARRALDGVSRTEDGVHRFEPVLRLFQAQQGRFHLGQQLTAFGNESLQCGFEVHARFLPQAAVGMTRGSPK